MTNYHMSQQLKTILHWRYEVSSPEACSVSRTDGSTICQVAAGVPAEFTADGADVILSSNLATMLPLAGKVVQQTGGSAAAGLSATGEPVVALSGAMLNIKHATWYDNAEQSSITVNPAPWKNEVMTCYLKTAVPVELSSVTWLYGQPVMVEDYTYVIALQQLDAATVLANLAYTIPQ